MSSVKSAGTRLEQRFALALHEASMGAFVVNSQDIDGKPDFVFREAGVAVFIDSCFWHGCHWHCRMPEANADYWQAKIARNRQRDKQVTRALRYRGWRVIRLWEHTLKTDAGIARAVRRVRNALELDT